MDREPLVGVAKVRQVEPAEPGKRHPRTPDDEVILGSSAPRSIPDGKVEGLASPFREHGDRIVEWAGIEGAKFEQSREFRTEPGRGLLVDLFAY